VFKGVPNIGFRAGSVLHVAVFPPPLSEEGPSTRAILIEFRSALMPPDRHPLTVPAPTHILSAPIDMTLIRFPWIFRKLHSASPTHTAGSEEYTPHASLRRALYLLGPYPIKWHRLSSDSTSAGRRPYRNRQSLFEDPPTPARPSPQLAFCRNSPFSLRSPAEEI